MRWLQRKQCGYTIFLFAFPTRVRDYIYRNLVLNCSRQWNLHATMNINLKLFEEKRYRQRRQRIRKIQPLM